MESNEANVKGYFENLDFYDFHQAVLKSQGISEDGWTLQERIEVEDRFVDLAKQVVERSAVSRLWGWKDPRTTLFLDFWSQQLPQTKFLLVYRSPWEVVDSLYRRGSDRVLMEQPELAVKMWLHYNRKVLNFYNQATDRCFLLNIETLVSDFNGFVTALNQKFGLDLMVPEATGYDPALFQRLEPNGYRASLVAHYFPEAVEMYRELEVRAWQSRDTLDPSWEEQLKSYPYRVWAFQDWLGVGKLKGENKKLQEELQQERSQQQQLREELQQERSQQQQLREELGQTQVQLHETEEVLEQSQSQLHETESVLEKSVDRLQQQNQEEQRVQSELDQTRSKLEEVQTQFSKTEEILEQYQSHLQQSEEVLEQSQSQLKETEQLLEEATAQLYQTRQKLKNYQAECDRLQFKESLFTSFKHQDKKQHYKLLVLDAWYAYQSHDTKKMADCLKRSLQISSLSRTETIQDWLGIFSELASRSSYQLNLQDLTSSIEWQQLVHYLTAAKPLKVRD
ncbi:hypothetical protein CKA32_002920 [Geitlerinema sp. FC II]|nr:hypothetical protein CKA32_002920 [Geitlerinema sp. FC II]